MSRLLPPSGNYRNLTIEVDGAFDLRGHLADVRQRLDTTPTTTEVVVTAPIG